MEYHKLQSWTYFWSNEPDISVPFASTVTHGNRFAEILSHLHMNDNLLTPRVNTDRLYKLHSAIRKFEQLLYKAS